MASCETASFPLRSYGKWCPSQQGATLVWRDVCVYATNATSTMMTANNDEKKTTSTSGNQFKSNNVRGKNVLLKRIINNATGAIRPGTLMALMGSRFV